MSRKFWQFKNQAGAAPELLLYGDIADSTWWGDEATPKQFKEDLDALGPVAAITVRINSGGGDVFAAQAIGNMLEQHGAKVTARLDGLCASAATIVACHCDRVEAARDSTYMVHPVRMCLYGYYDAVEMGQYLAALDTIKKNIIGLYVKKTGRSEEEVTAWMDGTSWWTGEEAAENGFVDQVLEDEGAATVENRGGILFVNSVDTHMPFDKAPKNVRDRLAGAPGGPENKTGAGTPGKDKEEGNMEIKTVDELRKRYPDLVGQVEQTAADQARQEERERIRDIEDMTLVGGEEEARQAKYDKPVSADAFARAALQKARQQGSAYLAKAGEDAKNSGAGSVGQAGQDDGKQDDKKGGKAEDSFLNAIRAIGKKNGKQ